MTVRFADDLTQHKTLAVLSHQISARPVIESREVDILV